MAMLYSCKKDLPNGGIPSYLRIDAVQIDPNATVGAPTHNVSNLVISTGGSEITAVEFPTVVPVLAEGQTDIRIQPEVKLNGISARRINYPFYFTDTASLLLSATDTTTYIPTFRYFDNTQLAVNEVFVSGTNFTNILSVNDCNDCAAPDGDCRCGRITVSPAQPTVQASIGQVNVPFGGPVFIELDYQADVAFLVGIRGNDGLGFFDFPKVVVNPKTNWNKIYIEMSEEVNNRRAGTYEFYISTGIDNDSTESSVFIDNFKVVHF